MLASLSLFSWGTSMFSCIFLDQLASNLFYFSKKSDCGFIYQFYYVLFSK